MTLRVGDKVRITGSRSATDVALKFKGLEAEVVTLKRDECLLKPLSPRPDGWGEGRFYWTSHYLEKIEPEPKFKVGDRVRSLLHDNERVVVTVTSPRHGSWNFVRAQFRDGTYGLWKESELELVEDQPRPLGLRAGDKVVNLKTGREGLVLKGPISGELKVYDQKPPIRDAVPAAALEEYEFHYPGTYDVWRRVVSPRTQPW